MSGFCLMLFFDEAAEALSDKKTVLIIGFGKHCSSDYTCNGFLAKKI